MGGTTPPSRPTLGHSQEDIVPLPAPRQPDIASQFLTARPTESEALALASCDDLASLQNAAASIRDEGFGQLVSYSRKVFLPLTHLCRDICSYCVFAQAPKPGEAAYLTPEQVVASAQRAETQGCKEALFTLGDKPEERWQAARDDLARLGHKSTLSYLKEAAELVFKETGLLPHLNPGILAAADFEALRPVSASMGIMLETTSERLLEKGQVHYGCPDKHPAVRLETIRLAGVHQVPFTSGILIGIGETRRERIEAMLALRRLNDEFGHIQEIIVQNFRAKPETRMAGAEEPDLNDLLWTIAITRIVFGPEMSVQVPPNLSDLASLEALIAAGINDWGGVSPVTPDFVNPEAPWPHLETLGQETSNAGKHLLERLTIYPDYALDGERWLDPAMRTPVLQRIDSHGYPRTDDWTTGAVLEPPAHDLARLGLKTQPSGALQLESVTGIPTSYDHDAPEQSDQALDSRECPNWVALESSTLHLAGSKLAKVLERATAGEELTEAQIEQLFAVRGDAFTAVCSAADQLRQAVNGDTVTYAVNRNINYTNLCYFKCQFCAFSKGKMSENLRGKPYDLALPEIARRTREGWQRGATEVCMQGGIHPDYTGNNYLEICQTVKAAVPQMHIHAFSPLEVWQGAATLGLSLEEFLQKLKHAGLGTLPGTAAEILDDEVREVLCADKIRTDQWLEVMETAHSVGFRTTATIMYGHIERPVHWARHLLRLRRLQAKTRGFTEFVPLPFVALEAPIYLKGMARGGPTFRESVLMHAVARLVLFPHFRNIQASWVKLGPKGVAACLSAGVNDLGGTLMNESITRAAGAAWGEELPPDQMETLIRSVGRFPKQRTTVYGQPSAERIAASFAAGHLEEIVNTPPKSRQASGNRLLLRPGLDG